MVWKMNEYLLHKFNSDNINKSILIFKLQSSAYIHFCCYSWYQSKKLSKVLKIVGGFPGGATGNECAYQGRRCKRCGFDPLVGKIPWRRARRPTPVFSPGESHGREPGRLQFMRSQRVGHDWSNLAHMHVEDCRMKVCSSKVFFLSDLTSKPLPHPVSTTLKVFSSVQSLSCPTLCNPMNRSTPGLPVHHQLPEPTQTHVRRLNDAIQPSHPLSSPSLPALNLSQHQGLFQWVSSSHQVARVLESF